MLTAIVSVCSVAFVVGMPIWAGSLAWLGTKADRAASQWIVERD